LKKKICVFAGSKTGINPENEDSAKIVGKIIAESNFDIIYGGGEKGIMGAVASSGIRFGAKTTGIIPKFLMSKDIVNSSIPNQFNSELILTKTMHERKKLMYDKSESFVILPGGIGTLDECFEVLTWCQLDQIKNKKVGILNFQGYWNPLIFLIKHLIDEDFMTSDNLNYFEEIRNINEFKKYLKNI
jgi:uncharacterized protein (TIGR00730 family)